MAYTKALRCQLITPAGEVFDRQVRGVTLPATDGQVGVLPNHAPLVVALGEGSVSFRQADGRSFQINVAGGYAEVYQNVLTILPGRAGRLVERGKLDEAELDSARQELQQYRGRRRPEQG